MKSGDEIKKGLNDPIHVHYHIGDIEPRLTPLAFRDLEFLHADALAYIQQLEAQVPRWISVEERLPDVDVDVVLIIPRIDGPCIRVGWLRKTGRWWAAGQGIVPYEVTHWMPMPEPPEA